VQKGPVVDVALEGGRGFTHRVEAFRRRHDVTDAPFYLITDRTDLGPSGSGLTRCSASQRRLVEGSVMLVAEAFSDQAASSKSIRRTETYSGDVGSPR